MITVLSAPPDANLARRGRRLSSLRASQPRLGACLAAQRRVAGRSGGRCAPLAVPGEGDAVHAVFVPWQQGSAASESPRLPSTQPQERQRRMRVGGPGAPFNECSRSPSTASYTSTRLPTAAISCKPSERRHRMRRRASQQRDVSGSAKRQAADTVRGRGQGRGVSFFDLNFRMSLGNRGTGRRVQARARAAFVSALPPVRLRNACTQRIWSQQKHGARARLGERRGRSTHS